MAFQVSPGVLVKEKDLTNVIPAVATTIGAVAGQFNQGPMDEVTSISSEKELVETFGKPDSLQTLNIGLVLLVSCSIHQV